MLCRLFVKSSFAIISLGKTCYCILGVMWLLLFFAFRDCVYNHLPFFADHLLLFMFRFCNVFLSVHSGLVVTYWERANLLALLCVAFCCVLSVSRVVSWVGCGT